MIDYLCAPDSRNKFVVITFLKVRGKNGDEVKDNSDESDASKGLK